MKYIILALITMLAVTNITADVNVNVDGASAYVFRGATLNNGLVLQPSVELINENVSVGTWVNFDQGDYDGNIDGNQVSELDIYAM